MVFCVKPTSPVLSYMQPPLPAFIESVGMVGRTGEERVVAIWTRSGLRYDVQGERGSEQIYRSTPLASGRYAVRSFVYNTPTPLPHVPDRAIFQILLRDGRTMIVTHGESDVVTTYIKDVGAEREALRDMEEALQTEEGGLEQFVKLQNRLSDRLVEIRDNYVVSSTDPYTFELREPVYLDHELVYSWPNGIFEREDGSVDWDACLVQPLLLVTVLDDIRRFRELRAERIARELYSEGPSEPRVSRSKKRRLAKTRRLAERKAAEAGKEVADVDEEGTRADEEGAGADEEGAGAGNEGAGVAKETPAGADGEAGSPNASAAAPPPSPTDVMQSFSLVDHLTIVDRVIRLAERCDDAEIRRAVDEGSLLSELAAELRLEDKCALCHAKDRTHAFIPCMHRCVCSDCAADAAVCPLCKKAPFVAPRRVHM